MSGSGMRREGRHALVTDGAKGIRYAIAEQLASEGDCLEVGGLRRLGPVQP